MPCTVCNHPQLADIELALLAGDTLKSLHQRYGLSPSALQRHKKHLESKMRSVRYRLDNRQDQNCLLRLNKYLDRLDRTIEQAEADGEIDRVIRGCLAGSRIMQQMQRLQVEWDLDSVYRLTHFAAPAYLDSLLPAGPGALSELNRAFLNKAASPCPEPEGEEAGPGRGAAAATEPVASSDAETLRLETLSVLRDLLPGVDLSLDDIPELPDQTSASQTVTASPQNSACCLSPGVNLSLDDIPLLNDKEPKNQRQISEKSPANTASQTNKSEEIQEDSHSEIIFAKNSAPESSFADSNDISSSAPSAANDLLSDPLPLTTDPCLSETANDLLTETAPPEPQRLVYPSWTPDELFEISHGYKRDNPPKNKPHRYHPEDFPSRSVFKDLEKYF